MHNTRHAPNHNLRQTAPKPDGGFCLVSVSTLLAAWWAYRAKIMHLRDLRVWLACLELISRRCGLEAGRKPRYRIREIQTLVGLQSERSIPQSVKRLVRIGILECSKGRLAIPRSASISEHMPSDECEAGFSKIRNGRRLVPVPRRLLRYLAGRSQAALIGTAFGHLLRCMFYRNGECVAGGRCKASWIAELFELDVRTVKRARKQLTAIGWMEPVEATQCELNRWGMAVRLNLMWSPNDVRPEHETTPPRSRIDTGSPPPMRNKKLSSRVKNQEPAKRGPVGVCTNSPSQRPPDLRRVTRDDLDDPSRLVVLLEQAIRKCWISSTTCDRLRFFSAAQRALRVGNRNPSGLFVSLVRNARWKFISQIDEDRAVQTLKELEGA